MVVATPRYVVDTHALVWFLEGNPRLGRQARAILEDVNSALVLPVIALAEACWIVEHGRTSIPSVEALLAAIDADPRVRLASLDRLVLEKTLSLTAITEMHDRQIVATVLCLQETGYQVAALTKDANIQGAEVVSSMW
jgi:PIN domain nuclease of toxin-antitoxin system